MKYAMKIAAFKEAYDLNNATKVLGLAKKKMLPRAAVRMYPEPMQKMVSLGPTAFSGRQSQNKVTNIRSAFSNAVKTKAPWTAELIDSAGEGMKPLTSLQNQMASKMPQGAILPAKGNAADATRRMQSMGVPLKDVGQLTPDQHKMFNSIFAGHEMDELAVKPATAMLGAGHLSPDVILREHNRLVTMPSSYAPVKEQMQGMRRFVESPLLETAGIQYGEGERLSRHARKRITQMMEEQSLPRTMAQLETMKKFINQG